MERRNSKQKVLYVDLDGTFIKTDMLVESCLSLLVKNPVYLLYLPFWLMSGIANLKSQIAKRVTLDFRILPLNPELTNFLWERKEKGWEIILATASNDRIAKGIVKTFNIFDRYISSSDDTNLKSLRKLEKINAISGEFSYCGNSMDDIVIFQHANESILVNPSSKKVFKAARPFVSQTLDNQKENTMKLWIKQLRVYQWVKNTLVVVPLILSQTYYEGLNAFYIIVAFFCFSFLASATYIFNDILDINADRVHPTKKFRPIAHGDIPLPSAIIVALVIGLGSLITAYFISLKFLIVLIGYLCITLFYSSKLKRYMGLDIVALAGLYTIRVVAGAAVIG